MNRAAVATRRSPSTPAARERDDASGARLPRALIVWAGCLVLFVAYFAFAIALDPRGPLLADSGGKLATMRVMEERGSLDPDVGYWAADVDPDGDLHPLRFTSRLGDDWVQVTTLPMIVAAYPLYEVGGIRAALVLPMLGGVLVALAARALAMRLGANRRTAWISFWSVGLLTPVLLYAVSFWEHSLGLAAMTWAVVLALDVLDGRGGWRGAVAVGALFGLAATMRTEALVYFATTAFVVLVVLVSRRTALARLVACGVGAVGGLAGVLLANDMLERLVVGSSLRAGRTTGTAAVAADALRTRIDGAVTSLVGMNGFGSGSSSAVGLLVVALIGVSVLLMCSDRRFDQRIGVGLVVIAGCVYIARSVVPVYLPGLLVASPLAAAGLLLAWRSSRLRIVAVMALLPLPLVWATQFLDTQRYQWGNRFALVSGVLLATIAVVVLATRWMALGALLVLSLLVVAVGADFLVNQSHSIADGMERLVQRDGLVVTTEEHLWREGGAFYEPGREWLVAADLPDLRRVASLAAGSGLPELTVVAADRTALPDTLGGYRGVEPEVFELLPHGDLQVRRYVASG